MVVAIVGIIFFIGLPLIQASGTNSGPSAEPVQRTTVLPFSVPATTAPPSGTLLPSGDSGVSSGTIIYRSGVPYNQVYSQHYDLGKAHGVFSYTLQEPSLLIECDMNPEMVTREKLVDIGTSKERYITATYANPNAWLDLTVINADTGGIITKISFSKNYVGMTKQDYTIRVPGNYRFEMDGNLVSPSVRLLVKK